MTKYLGRNENDVDVYVSMSGHIAIKSIGLEDGRDVTILLTPRQAELIASDLPDFAVIAEREFMEKADE